MSKFAQIVTILCAALPAWVVGAALSVLTILLVLAAIKVVTFVKNAIPFL